MVDVDQRLMRIGVFYDGNFFLHVSSYYRYNHRRKKYISIPGLHEFIRHKVAEVEGVDVRYCHIIDAHFFRGRLSAKEADARQKLYHERIFEDILMWEGVVTHYLPLRHNTEKGIDVWLALEAFELAVYKRFDVLVLVAGDSDFIPLARKVNSLGTRVMVLGWNFGYTDEFGQDRETVTSSHLLEEVTYPVRMHDIIDEESKREDFFVKGLFEEQKGESALAARTPDPSPSLPAPAVDELIVPVAEEIPARQGSQHEGEILSLKDGYGFIKCTQYPENVYFKWNSLTDIEFDSLRKGQRVKFTVKVGERGPAAFEIGAV